MSDTPNEPRVVPLQTYLELLNAAECVAAADPWDAYRARATIRSHREQIFLRTICAQRKTAPESGSGVSA
jgi:hypothetical protein